MLVYVCLSANEYSAVRCFANCFDDFQWVRLTDDGNLDYVMDNGVTVGQESCRAMAAHGHPNLPPHDVSFAPFWYFLRF